MPKVSYEQSDLIRTWLAESGFQIDEQADSGQVERWFREVDGCQVRVTRRARRARVEVHPAGACSSWRELDELVDSRAAWPEAKSVSPMELATLPQRHPPRERVRFRRAPGGWLYERGKPWAFGIKVFLQMLVGLGAAVDIGIHVTHSVVNYTDTTQLAPPAVVSVRVIAYALAVAAAIELAYTLFTPGPDEALDPLMLGLSSGILLLITTDVSSPTVKYSGILIGVFALAGLFLVRKYLFREDEE